MANCSIKNPESQRIFLNLIFAGLVNFIPAIFDFHDIDHCALNRGNAPLVMCGNGSPDYITENAIERHIKRFKQIGIIGIFSACMTLSAI